MIGTHTVGLRCKTRLHTMPQDRKGQPFDILTCDVSTPVKERPRLAAEDEKLGSTRTRSPRYVLPDQFRRLRILRTCLARKIENKLVDMLRNGNLAHKLLKLEKVDS